MNIERKRIGAYVRFESSIYDERRRKDGKTENVSYPNNDDFQFHSWISKSS
jgi:hypothetical protein